METTITVTSTPGFDAPGPGLILSVVFSATEKFHNLKYNLIAI